MKLPVGLHIIYKCRCAGNMAVLLFALCVFSGRAGAQNISQQGMDNFRIMEDSLIVSADSMFNAYIPDMRIGLSEKFARQLVRTLKMPGSYYYPFDSLKQVINMVYPPDGSFRIFNWEITPNAVSKRYYGAIQMPSEKLKLYGLRDYTDELGHGAEDSILTGGKWFGALYYRIMPEEVQGNKVYFLFGENESDPRGNKKVLDVLTFTPGGVQFGAPLFGVASENIPKQRIDRFILEYKKEVHASMMWDNERQMIVFDKLVSQVNDPHRKYTYVPSGEYDGFRWDRENGMWVYVKDLIPVQILKDGEQPLTEPARDERQK